ncbi:MAG: glycosyltransferase family 2 protein [Mycoplasma sp.]|nr:glycosyltransferase family 2 protein [Mycoplasma sp.]
MEFIDLETPYRRKPILSIIISSDNNWKALKKCVDSFLILDKGLKNIEFIIINNLTTNYDHMNEIKAYVDSLASEMPTVIFYQTIQRLSSSQIKNLALDFISGSWLFFIDYYDEASPKFLAFLRKFKFDIYKDFYRIPILNEKSKKIKIGLVKNKYFSTSSSTIIFNQEFIEKHNIKWENGISCSDTLPLLSKIYSIRNVNYVYLSDQSSTIHNFKLENKNKLLIDFSEVLKTYDVLLRNKNQNYKQFIIILFFDYLNRIKKRKDLYKEQIKAVKKHLRLARIHHLNYFYLGPILYFKTITFRWLTKF